MAKFIMMSTLTDEGRKTLKERPERLQEVNIELEELGARGTIKVPTLPAVSIDEFIRLMSAHPSRR